MSENKDNITQQTAKVSEPTTAPGSDQIATNATQRIATPVAAAPVADIPVPDNATIAIDEFFKVQLRVGQILSAEPVPKSEKLLKLQVDLGEEKGPRQIVSGIAKHYTPDSLPGRKIVVVANLKPAKLMGLMSEGMLLAACDDADNLELVSPGAAMVVGATVR